MISSLKMNKHKRHNNMNKNRTKEPYVKPEAEIVNLELEQPILVSSGDYDFGNGGFWG